MNVKDHEEQELSEEGVGRASNICGALWKTYTKKGTWLICNTCDDYVYSCECVLADTDSDYDFHYCFKVQPNIQRYVYVYVNIVHNEISLFCCKSKAPFVLIYFCFEMIYRLFSDPTQITLPNY